MLGRWWRGAWNAWYRWREPAWDRTQAFKYHLDFRPVIRRQVNGGILENGAWLDHLETVGWRFAPREAV